MNNFKWIFSTALLSLSFTHMTFAANADAIYFGGNIITINDAQPSAEAVAIKDGKIVAVGTRAAVDKAQKGSNTQMINLAGKTLVPGFVDGHSHFSEVGIQTVAANLLSPPDGPVKSIPELQQVMRDFIATSPMVKAHGVAIGMNYDDSQLVEHRHPTRQELDAVSTEIPIMVSHQSGHFGVLNSKALTKVGLSAASVNPDGGIIRREADGKTPSGVLEENAFFGVVYKMFPAFTPEEIVAQLKASEAIYLANGFTTIQEGKTTAANVKLLSTLAAKKTFKADIVSYPDIATTGDAPFLHGPLMSRSYTNHFRIGGVKLTLDGSPQGKTGWFTQPYFKAPEGQPADYKGYPAFTDAELNKWIMLAYKNNWQVFAHCSGDAPVDQFIKTVQAAQTAYPGTDRRATIIHGHFVRADQIPQIKALGIFVSAFPLHTFNWGDWHRQEVVGPERAENISPTGWYLENNIKFSIHSDAPVIFPDSMQLIATAVNRTTRTGYVLGPQHRLEPIVALKAMTLWPAYQHFEEKTKGSIEVGKLADFVVLSDNPLIVDRAKLNKIKVDETIKEGKSVYTRAASSAADSVYKNGKIYTVNEHGAWAEAVAIKDGKFLTVGSNADVEKTIGKDTEIIDLGGKFAMPGIHDLHAHPGYKYAYKIDGQLDFPPTATKAEIQAALKDHVAKHPEQKWIRGKQWAHALFPPEGKMPKEFIDAVVSDRAVVLVAESGHNVTVNSRALQLAGITKNTPNPEGGVIDKDPKTGEPTGYLGEEAIALVGKFIPIPSNESWYQALGKALDEMRSVGFTSIVDAKTGRGALMGYRRLEDEGKLSLRVQATLNIHDYALTVNDDEDSAKLINERKNFQSHLVNTNSVKVVADGTFLTFTCLLREPYSNNPKTKGETAIGINAKAQARLLEYHKAGIQLHFHAHGDGTIHAVLNMIEQFQKEFPRPGLHHHIAHTSLVDKEDIQRFKQLGVYADFSPPLYFPSVMSPLIDPIFGEERMQTTWYPIKDFVDAGVVTSFGSDWPLLFPDASPFPFMEAMVTRRDPWGKVPGQLGKPITLAQAIKIFTLGGAQVTMQEKENGSIEAGKYADMIVLDRNLFDIPVESIDSTKVLTTIFEGKVVYTKSLQ